jgi:hypothetical protein
LAPTGSGASRRRTERPTEPARARWPGPTRSVALERAARGRKGKKAGRRIKSGLLAVA